MRQRRVLLGCCLIALLSACAGAGTTSSGASHAAPQPESRPTAGGWEDRGPLLPARIGLARIESGRLTPIPGAEGETWREQARGARPAYGEFVPLDPQTTVDETQSGRTDLIDRVRADAARQGLDTALIYEFVPVESSVQTAPGISQLRVVGRSLVSSRYLGGTAHATLIDVRDGRSYGTATSRGTGVGFLANDAGTEGVRALAEPTNVVAVEKLAQDVGRMMDRLRSERNG